MQTTVINITDLMIVLQVIVLMCIVALGFLMAAIFKILLAEKPVVIPQEKGKLNIMSITLKDNQKATYQLKFVDAKGADTDATSVDLSLDPNPGNATITYDDPTNTVTVLAGLPGVHTIKTVAKDSAGNVLPFADEALEVTAGDAVSGSHSDPVIEQQ